MLRLQSRRVLAPEARLLVELDDGVLVLDDLARLVQLALGAAPGGGGLVAEVHTLGAVFDTALGTVLKA